MKRYSVALLILAALAVQSFATSVSVTNTKLQTKSGILTNVYFETASGPSSATPGTNTAQIPYGSSGSYLVTKGSTGYLWSPQFASGATISAGTWGFDFWASTISYVSITLTNSQSANTPSTLQEKITWNPSTYTSYEASDLGNIRFCSDSACVTMLSAWLESCTPSCSPTATSASAWVKLTSSITAGNTLTIYMAFLSLSTDFDGNYWGEAPNLSSPYGAHDNGANVFTFYDNFAGTSLSSKWTAIIGSSQYASVTVNNGLTVTTTSTGASAYAFVISASQSYPAVAETYTSAGNSILGEATTTSTNGFVAPYTGYSMDWYSNYDDLEYEAAGGFTQIHTITQIGFPTGIWQVTWSAIGTEYFVDGAGNTYTGSNNGGGIANYRIYVGQSNGVIASSTFRWARMRVFPQNDILPTVTNFGSVSSTANTLSVSIIVTTSSGSQSAVIASAVASPSLGPTESQLSLTVTGSSVSVPSNGYIEVSFAAATATDSVYWGSGQLTNFQVPYRVLT